MFSVQSKCKKNLFRIIKFLVFIPKMKRNVRIDIILFCLQNVDFISGLYSYLIGLKPVFAQNFARWNR